MWTDELHVESHKVNTQNTITKNSLSFTRKKTRSIQTTDVFLKMLREMKKLKHLKNNKFTCCWLNDRKYIKVIDHMVLLGSRNI